MFIKNSNKIIKSVISTITIIFCFSFMSSSLNSQNLELSDKAIIDDIFETKFTSKELESAPVKLIPYPQNIVWNNNKLAITDIYVKDVEKISPQLISEINHIFKVKNISINKQKKFVLRFKYSDKILQEGYELKVSKSGIYIAASGEAGFFYALQTLRQLIKTENDTNKIHLCKIKDKPQFPIRGFMIDVGRNFQSIALLKEQLDIMAKYKLNTFQWHLTDRPAWRIESKIYPELTDGKNHRPSRNPGKYYTYEEIRDFIKYAKSKHINVIPEIDIPGHSDSFIKSMGCKMESPEGMKILENVLKEFFNEIPKDLVPIFHMGSDEVKISNPEEFVLKMVNYIESHGRKVVAWTPGLKMPKTVTLQAWGEQKKKHDIEGYSEIDSKFSYINNFEPMSGVNQLFFRPIGDKSKNKVLGGILCLWPDVNVWSENDIYLQHPVYTSLLTYSWSLWTADVISSPKAYQQNLPLSGTKAANHFSAFEDFLLSHKEQYFSKLPFPYFKQSNTQWQLIGPFSKNQGDSLVKNAHEKLVYQGKTLLWKNAKGNSLIIKDRDTKQGHYPDAKPEETVYARTYIFSDSDKFLKAHINFESPLRANRIYTGIAKNESWDINGGKVWVNGKVFKGPKWENPGWKPFKQKGWSTGIDREIPWTDEELYWLREPAVIQLKKGWNEIMVKVPCTTKHQNWMFTFVPINSEGLRFSYTKN